MNQRPVVFYVTMAFNIVAAITAQAAVTVATVLPSEGELRAVTSWEGHLVAGLVAIVALWANFQLSIRLTTGSQKETASIVEKFAQAVERSVVSNEHAQNQQAKMSELVQVLVTILRSRPCLIQRGSAQDDKLETAIQNLNKETPQ